MGNKINSNASFVDQLPNRNDKATSAFVKIHHRLWNKRDMKLVNKIEIYRASVLTSLLCSSNL